MRQDAAIVSAYLDGVEGSAQVFNDFLEEHGRERFAEEANPAGRLRIVLEEYVSYETAQLLACEFAEHVADVVDPSGYPPGASACAAKRNYLAGELSEDQLKKAGAGALAEWAPNNSPKSRAIWASWAAAMATPSAAAASAQAARTDEIQWQIERVKQSLQGDPE